LRGQVELRRQRLLFSARDGRFLFSRFIVWKKDNGYDETSCIARCSAADVLVIPDFEL
jgi:hypothetical protein